MTERCAVCERAAATLQQRGPNLLCASCIAEQARTVAVAEQLKRCESPRHDHRPTMKRGKGAG